MAFWRKKDKAQSGQGDQKSEVVAPKNSQDAQSAADDTDDGQSDDAQSSGGIMNVFKRGLKKTVQVLNTDIRDIVGKDGRLVDDDFLRELFAQLVKTDMGAGPAGEIRDRIGTNFRARKVHMHELVASAKATILEIMQQPEQPIKMAQSGTTVVMVVGVNGSGKTTSIAKLTNMFTEQGHSVVLGAGDTFRAAAVEQLSIWANRLGATIVQGKSKSDPASVAFQAVQQANDSGADICIVDTAGRLQTQKNLMDELSKIRRVIGKVIPDAPHEVLLVLDATAGQKRSVRLAAFPRQRDAPELFLPNWMERLKVASRFRFNANSACR